MSSPGPNRDGRSEVVPPATDKASTSTTKTTAAHLYSCRHLFPADLTSPRPSESTRVWQGVSALTVSSVGVLSRLFLRYFNTVWIHNRERLIQVLEDRPKEVPVITVANHHSCMDEPLIWGNPKTSGVVLSEDHSDQYLGFDSMRSRIHKYVVLK